VHALAMPGALVASPTSVAGAWQRMHVGGVQLARATLDAPVEAPVPMLGLSFLVAMLLSHFVEHSAWRVAPHLVRAAGCLLRRAYGSVRDNVRSGPRLLLRGAYYAVIFFTTVWLLRFAIRGADASPTSARVQRIRAALDVAPLPTDVRAGRASTLTALLTITWPSLAISLMLWLHVRARL
jgi:hypothetical protein